jgi:hypothetical protein
MISSLPPTPIDAASELRRSRYWDAEQQVLANAKSPVTEAQRAIADAAGNPERLSVLAEQLPAHFRARGLPADWLGNEFTKASPELAGARSVAHDIERCEAVLRHDIAAVRRGIDAGRPADPQVLVDPSQFDPQRGN